MLSRETILERIAELSVDICVARRAVKRAEHVYGVGSVPVCNALSRLKAAQENLAHYTEQTFSVSITLKLQELLVSGNS